MSGYRDEAELTLPCVPRKSKQVGEQGLTETNSINTWIFQALFPNQEEKKLGPVHSVMVTLARNGLISLAFSGERFLLQCPSSFCRFVFWDVSCVPPAEDRQHTAEDAFLNVLD